MMFGIYICMCIKGPVVQHIKNAKYGSLPVNMVLSAKLQYIGKKKIRRSLGYNKFL